MDSEKEIITLFRNPYIPDEIYPKIDILNYINYISLSSHFKYLVR